MVEQVDAAVTADGAAAHRVDPVEVGVYGRPGRGGEPGGVFGHEIDPAVGRVVAEIVEAAVGGAGVGHATLIAAQGGLVAALLDDSDRQTQTYGYVDFGGLHGFHGA